MRLSLRLTLLTDAANLGDDVRAAPGRPPADASAVVVPALEARAGSSGGGGGGRGGSSGGSGGKSGGSSSSGKSGSSSSSSSSTSRGGNTYRYGSRTSGRTKSGLTSGRGGSSYHASVGTGLLLGGAVATHDAHCQVWPYGGPNGTFWGIAGCNDKQLRATRDVVRDVCGGNFSMAAPEDTNSWPVVGDNRGVSFAAQNATAANMTANDFYSCVVDNSDAHYGLSDGARIGIGVGSAVGAIALILGGCVGYRALWRHRALRRNV